MKICPQGLSTMSGLRLRKNQTITAAVIGLLTLSYLKNLPWFYLINGYRHPYLNEILSFFSFCGDGLVLGILVVSLFVYAEEYAVVGIVSLSTSGILVQLIKYFFPNPRPAGIMEGVKIIGPTLRQGAFPSGHTTTAFAAGFLFYYYFISRRKPVPGYLSLLLAALVGYSRIYVGAHFPVDVAAGAVIGFLFTKACCYRLTSIKEWFARQPLKNIKVIRRHVMEIFVAGGIYLGVFHGEVPAEEKASALVIALATTVYGLYHLNRERLKETNDKDLITK